MNACALALAVLLREKYSAPQEPHEVPRGRPRPRSWPRLNAAFPNKNKYVYRCMLLLSVLSQFQFFHILDTSITMKDTILCNTFVSTYNAAEYSAVVIADINTMDILAIVATAVKALV